jgi:hypothetical protein
MSSYTALFDANVLYPVIYAFTNQLDVAFTQLDNLIMVPGPGLDYGDLKTNLAWDPLRKDPRFDKLLAQLAPRD